jgi:hypothetical protein
LTLEEFWNTEDSECFRESTVHSAEENLAVFHMIMDIRTAEQDENATDFAV